MQFYSDAPQVGHDLKGLVLRRFKLIVLLCVNHAWTAAVPPKQGFAMKHSPSLVS